MDRATGAVALISGPGTRSTAPVARSIVSWSLPRRGAAGTVVIARRSAAAIIVPGAATVAISAEVSVGSGTRPPAAASATLRGLAPGGSAGPAAVIISPIVAMVSA